MRDPARIPRILQALQARWEEHPDLRFGQLLINLRLIGDDVGVWYRSDEKLEDFLTRKDVEQWPM